MSLPRAAKVVRKEIFYQSELVTAATTITSHSIAQLLMFNTDKHTHEVSCAAVCHQSEHETPTPAYVALKMHSATHRRLNQCTI